MEGINRVMAGVVLYNSDYDRLVKCLESLNGQVEVSILYDNSPKCMDKVKKAYLENAFKCRYIYSEKNIGMPEAMNEIMKMAEAEGIEWVLTMNADSIVPANMLKAYSEYFIQDEIGMICPQVVDRRRKYMHENMDKSNEYIDMCITAAACTRLKAWKQVGGFDGRLFVDLLDNDISKRMRLNGWKIYKINSILLDQEFGDIKPKGKRVELFWINIGKLMHNDNIAKFSYKKIVHPNRVYYTCRNIIYLNKKFVNYGGIGYEDNYNCHTFVGFLICFVLPSIFRASNKIEVIKAVTTGFKDGKKMPVEVWEATPI